MKSLGSHAKAVSIGGREAVCDFRKKTTIVVNENFFMFIMGALFLLSEKLGKFQ